MKYNFKKARVTVVGMARSGIAAALLLKHLGAIVTVIDHSDTPALRANKLKLEQEGIRAEIGVDELIFVETCDIMVISPGVSEDAQFIKLAQEKKIVIISELELGFQNCPAPIIAVTGTNGKTTVTSLIGEILKAAGKRVFVCGNIGRALCNYVEEAREDDYIVAEVSSFQLEKIVEFRPLISVFLNFTPDHLDRYKSVADYLSAKKKIFLNQRQKDYAVLNFSDATCRDLAPEIKAQVVFFNKPKKENKYLKLDPNQQAVMAVSDILKLDNKISLEVLRNFKGIEHRLESVRILSGVEFINDSKATNVDSSIWALAHMHKPVVLIAGGHDKGSELSPIRALVKEKVRCMVLIGEARDKFFSAFKDDTRVLKSDSLESAIGLAFEQARSGDCVLLSPMCASFDMFKDYEDRGKQFKQIVNSLKELKD